MSDREKLFKSHILDNLAKRLEKLESITQYDDGDEKEAGALIHALSDLEDSFHKLLFELFPRLAESNIEGDELEGQLFDIGDEIRHIYYHLKDPKFFRTYLGE